jgi:ankyrin repeat protein
MLSKHEEALLKACQDGNLAKIENALRAGARIGHPVYALQNAIAHHASMELIQRLLEAGADPKCAGNGIRSPLASAAENGEPETLNLLLHLGAPIDYRGLSRRTPLMLSTIGSTKRSIQCVSMLLMAGADPLLRDRYGKDAMALAKQRGNIAALDLIAPYAEAASTRLALLDCQPPTISKRTAASPRPRL